MFWPEGNGYTSMEINSLTRQSNSVGEILVLHFTGSLLWGQFSREVAPYEKVSDGFFVVVGFPVERWLLKLADGPFFNFYLSVQPSAFNGCSSILFCAYFTYFFVSAKYKHELPSFTIARQPNSSDHP